MKATYAILVAGGTGHRFKSQTPKQFLPLAGKAVIDHSLELFCSISDLAGIVLVLPSDFVSEWKDKSKAFTSTRIQVIAGGLTRQGSVTNGLRAVSEETKWILVHDVARPLVTVEMIESSLAAAKQVGAAVTAVPVADTLKRGDNASLVKDTVDRNGVHQIQTPQVFSKTLLSEALAWAKQEGLDATDEATLIEKMGKPVKLVEGSVFNFKVTRPEDLVLAEAYLRYRDNL